MRFYQYIFVFSLMIITSCSTHSDKKIKHIHVDNIKIKRYERALFSLDKNNLQSELMSIQKDFYPFMDDLSNPEKIKQMQDYLDDTIIKEIADDCEKVFPDLSNIEKDLTKSFRYYKLYFPNSSIPDLYTYVPGFSTDPIRYNGKSIIISLDMYLGISYKKYESAFFPKYKIKQFDKKYLVRDCMIEMAKSKCISNIQNPVFIDYAVYQGKLYAFTQAMLPDVAANEIIGYTKEQWEWCNTNKKNIWAFFIENDLLFESNQIKTKDFLQEAPFTADFSKKSPARIGHWIGWQIVKKYIKNNPEKLLSDIMKENSGKEILKKSYYKP